MLLLVTSECTLSLDIFALAAADQACPSCLVLPAITMTLLKLTLALACQPFVRKFNWAKQHRQCIHGLRGSIQKSRCIAAELKDKAELEFAAGLTDCRGLKVCNQVDRVQPSQLIAAGLLSKEIKLQQCWQCAPDPTVCSWLDMWQPSWHFESGSAQLQVNLQIAANTSLQP